MNNHQTYDAEVVEIKYLERSNRPAERVSWSSCLSQAGILGEKTVEKSA